MKTPNRGSLVPESPAEKLAALKKIVKAKKPKAKKEPRGIVYDCKLPQMRERLGLTQRDVCRATGLTPGGYHQIEHGYEVVLTSALRLSEFFAVPINEIWVPLELQASDYSVKVGSGF